MFSLVRGVDESAVVPYKAPKSMSNEDNVGHCTSLATVAIRLEPLVSRLLGRVDVEREIRGRTPRTLRLSVRRRRYRDQASKQVPLPQSMLLRQGDERVSAFMDVCMGLFRQLGG